MDNEKSGRHGRKGQKRKGRSLTPFIFKLTLKSRKVGKLNSKTAQTWMIS